MLLPLPAIFIINGSQPPRTPGSIDHKDMLGWLGDWCQADSHPVSWSVTQNWQTVALGMPRLCSAKRLVDGMVEEIFG